MKTGDFLSLDYPKNYFSCIYLNHVLEHPKSPGKYLEKIYKLLSHGGILYIACPNIKSFSIFMKTIFEKIGLKKNKGKHYETWQHLIYYNPVDLKKFLENNQ